MGISTIVKMSGLPQQGSICLISLMSDKAFRRRRSGQDGH